MSRSQRSVLGDISATGRYCGALSVRWGVRLWDDSYISLGAPVAVGVSACGSMTGEANAVQSGSQYVGVDESEMQINSYRLGVTPVRCFDSGWDGVVKSVDILVSDAEALWRPGDLSLRCEESNVGGVRRSVLRVSSGDLGVAPMMRLAGMKQWRVAASITDFSALRRGEISVSALRLSSTSAQQPRTYAMQGELASAQSVTAAEVAKVIGGMCAKMRMHSACDCGGALAVGGITREREIAWHLWEQCSDFTTDACVAVEELTLVDSAGEHRMLTMKTLPYTPMRLSTIVSAPDSRIRSARMRLYTTTGEREWRAELMPIAGHGTSANVVKTEQTPVVATLSQGLPQSNLSYTEESKGVVLMSGKGNPLVLYSVGSVGGSVVDVASAVRPMYNGGFGRYPLYVFGNDGVYALSQTSGGAYGEVRRMSSGVLRRRGELAVCCEKLWLCDADGYLCELNGRDVERRVRLAGNRAALAWNRLRGELWVVDEDAQEVFVVQPSGSLSRRDISLGSVWSDGRYAFGVDDAGVLVDLRHETVGRVRVRWLSEPMPLGAVVKSALRYVQWGLAGAGLNLNLSVLGERGLSCHGFLMHRLRVRGAVNAPVESVVVPVAARNVRLLVEGEVDDVILTDVKMV